MSDHALFSIGHSNHPWPSFLNLLQEAGILLLLDVRSRPYSRFAWFNRERLHSALAAAGIRYLWMGEALGGKPDDPTLYHGDGKPDYPAIAAGEDFQEGISRVLAWVRSGPRTAVMCAEGDPVQCHREHLIAVAIRAAGVRVVHLLPDGGRLLV